ncbi:MAG TPA: hypothetical protein VGB17_19875 [Pyrinomonadaceae bacterium]|jgi:hypothetical protein
MLLPYRLIAVSIAMTMLAIAILAREPESKQASYAHLPGLYGQTRAAQRRPQGTRRRAGRRTGRPASRVGKAAAKTNTNTQTNETANKNTPPSDASSNSAQSSDRFELVQSIEQRLSHEYDGLGIPFFSNSRTPALILLLLCLLVLPLSFYLFDSQNSIPALVIGIASIFFIVVGILWLNYSSNLLLQGQIDSKKVQARKQHEVETQLQQLYDRLNKNVANEGEKKELQERMKKLKDDSLGLSTSPAASPISSLVSSIRPNSSVELSLDKVRLENVPDGITIGIIVMIGVLGIIFLVLKNRSRDSDGGGESSGGAGFVVLGLILLAVFGILWVRKGTEEQLHNKLNEQVVSQRLASLGEAEREAYTRSQLDIQARDLLDRLAKSVPKERNDEAQNLTDQLRRILVLSTTTQTPVPTQTPGGNTPPSTQAQNPCVVTVLPSATPCPPQLSAASAGANTSPGFDYLLLLLLAALTALLGVLGFNFRQYLSARTKNLEVENELREDELRRIKKEDEKASSSTKKEDEKTSPSAETNPEGPAS